MRKTHCSFSLTETSYCIVLQYIDQYVKRKMHAHKMHINQRYIWNMSLPSVIRLLQLFLWQKSGNWFEKFRFIWCACPLCKIEVQNEWLKGTSVFSSCTVIDIIINYCNRDTLCININEIYLKENKEFQTTDTYNCLHHYTRGGLEVWNPPNSSQFRHQQFNLIKLESLHFEQNNIQLVHYWILW